MLYRVWRVTQNLLSFDRISIRLLVDVITGYHLLPNVCVIPQMISVGVVRMIKNL